jgi:hypothetical protein
VGLSLLGTAAGQLVGLYQTVIVRRLPDPPSDLFDPSRVDASDYAYSRLHTPDAFMMIATYGVTAGLAAAGGRDRAREQPWLPIATLAETLYDSSVALAVPEAVEAARSLMDGRGDEGRGGNGRGEHAYPVG